MTSVATAMLAAPERVLVTPQERALPAVELRVADKGTVVLAQPIHPAQVVRKRNRPAAGAPVRRAQPLGVAVSRPRPEQLPAKRRVAPKPPRDAPAPAPPPPPLQPPPAEAPPAAPPPIPVVDDRADEPAQPRTKRKKPKKPRPKPKKEKKPNPHQDDSGGDDGDDDSRGDDDSDERGRGHGRGHEKKSKARDAGD